MVNSTATAGNIMKGGSRFIHNFGIRNTFIGELAGNFVLTGSDNAGVGNGALVANTSGAQNTASGAIALLNNKSGNINTAIGNSALLRSESGDYNTAVGYNAGSLLTTGSNNIYLGNFGSAIESGTIHIGTGGIHLKTFAAGIRGVAPGVADALPVVIDSNGQLGTGSVAGAGVTNIATGAGLSGGPITSTGTINLTATQLLPTVACAANQFPQWSGMAWICATGTGSSTTSDVTGNLTMVNSTATAGNILKGGTRFIHNFGTLNTFIGEFAGNFVMTGSLNTGSGGSALLMNTSGEANTAHGYGALQLNQTGSYNTAIGHVALGGGNSGDFNTASGGRALYGNTTGIYNTANGYNALANNTTGFGNTALGLNALESNVAGNNNIAIGSQSGNLLTGNNNIAIGSSGVAGESGTLRIGAAQSKTYISGIYGSTASGGAAVFANSAGQLGTISSSRRYKDEIADMDAASSALMRLRPVTFHYKTDQNSAGRTLQYGLIAEEVAEIYPGLIAHSADGQIETVMYQHLPPMLLNELQKQQRTIKTQETELVQLRAKIAALEAHSARQETIERELNRIKQRLALD